MTEGDGRMLSSWCECGMSLCSWVLVYAAVLLGCKQIDEEAWVRGKLLLPGRCMMVVLRLVGIYWDEDGRAWKRW